MSLKCGIVGLPNVGKSTLFNAITKTSQAECANYPFCTIEPNVASVPIKDQRIDELAKIVGSQKKIFCTLTMVDIAGLVKGASKGTGMGNKFLSHIRDVDLIIHVVRCFKDDDIIHVSNQIDPIDDINSIEDELIIADLELIEKNIETYQKKLKNNHKDVKQVLDIMIQCRSALTNNIFISDSDIKSDDLAEIGFLNLITTKKIFYVANVAQDFNNDSKEYVRIVQEYANKKGRRVIPVSAILEHEFSSCSEFELKELLTDIGMEDTGISRITNTGYQMLDRITFLTVGPQEARAWSIKNGSTAPQAAGKIHSDIEKGFIKAEIVSYDDFIFHKGIQESKNKGKVRIEGKDYIMQDGDVCDFKFKS